jgi:hypothetical protein
VIKSRKIRWEGHVPHMGDEKCISILAGKSVDKKPIERPKYRWKDDTKITLMEFW